MSKLDFVDLLKPVKAKFTGHDPLDVFMKDTVSFSLNDYDHAEVVILGCPQDLGVSRNQGRVGAKGAPAEIRRYLYKFKPPVKIGTGLVLDMGDIAVDAELEEIHTRLNSVVSRLVKDGKKVVVLGGGNDISWPDASALGNEYPGFTAINLDAHLDMRISDHIHSGTPYRKLIESGALRPENFHEVGIQPWANSPKYLNMAGELGVNVHTLRQVRKAGVVPFFTRLLDRITKPVFLGLDMDSVRASDAPGVSASSPVGFSAEDILTAVGLARKTETRIFEITEVNPNHDLDGRTCRLAALAVYSFLFTVE